MGLSPKPASFSNRLFQHFEENGFTGNQVYKAIIVHELLGIAMLAITWTTCYFVSPSQHKLLKEPIARMMGALPQGISGKFDNPIFTSRMGQAYLESSCLRKIIRPFTLPTKLVVTFKLCKALTALEEKWENKKNSASVKQAAAIFPIIPLLSDNFF